MASIRNLRYQNSIVEQPIYDGVPLTRWIHDGVVVWENGLQPLYFSNIVTGYDGSVAIGKIICIDARRRTVKFVELPSYCTNTRLDISDIRDLNLMLFRNYQYGDSRDYRWFTQDFTQDLYADGDYGSIYSYLDKGSYHDVGYVDGSHVVTVDNDYINQYIEIEINYDLYPFDIVIHTTNLESNTELFPTRRDMKANGWTFSLSTTLYSPNFYGAYFKDTIDNLVWSAIPCIDIGHPHVPYMIKISSNGTLTLSDFKNVIGRINCPALLNTDNAFLVNDKFIFKVRSGNNYYIYTINKAFNSVSYRAVSKRVYYSCPIATHNGYTYLFGLGGVASGGGWEDTDYFLVTSDFIYFAEYKYSEITRTIPLVNPSTGQKIDDLTISLGGFGYNGRVNFISSSRVAIDNETTGMHGSYSDANNEYYVYFEDYMFGSPYNFAVRKADIS